MTVLGTSAVWAKHEPTAIPLSASLDLLGKIGGRFEIANSDKGLTLTVVWGKAEIYRAEVSNIDDIEDALADALWTFNREVRKWMMS